MKKNYIFLFLTILVFLNKPTSSSAQINMNDSLILVNLYNKTDGPHWARQLNWLTSAPVNTWSGVRVKASRVIELDLSFNHITGQIPVELGKLAKLRTLYLTGNSLSGSVISQFGNLSELTILDLSQNQLTGNIPPELCHLLFNAERSSLSLGNNQLIGNIPSELGNCTKLYYLGLSNNLLTGNIPPEIKI